MQCLTRSASQLLSDKVDGVVAAYPAYPYQTALSHGAIKQVLLDYVECKLKQTMPKLNQPQEWQCLPQYLHRLVDLELRLESYIYWGIEYIIQEQFDLLLSDVENPGASLEPAWSVQDMTQTCMPSHWFG